MLSSEEAEMEGWFDSSCGARMVTVTTRLQWLGLVERFVLLGWGKFGIE